MVTMLQDPDRERSNRVMQAMMQMKKLALKRLEQAFAGP